MFTNGVNVQIICSTPNTTQSVNTPTAWVAR